MAKIVLIPDADPVITRTGYERVIEVKVTNNTGTILPNYNVNISKDLAPLTSINTGTTGVTPFVFKQRLGIVSKRVLLRFRVGPLEETMLLEIPSIIAPTPPPPPPTPPPPVKASHIQLRGWLTGGNNAAVMARLMGPSGALVPEGNIRITTTMREDYLAPTGTTGGNVFILNNPVEPGTSVSVFAYAPNVSQIAEIEIYNRIPPLSRSELFCALRHTFLFWFLGVFAFLFGILLAIALPNVLTGKTITEKMITHTGYYDIWWYMAIAISAIVIAVFLLYVLTFYIRQRYSEAVESFKENIWYRRHDIASDTRFEQVEELIASLTRRPDTALGTALATATGTPAPTASPKKSDMWKSVGMAILADLGIGGLIQLFMHSKKK